MNCPSRNDDTNKHPNWNQAPPALTADLTTRADLNGIANMREREDQEDSRQQDERIQASMRGAECTGGKKADCGKRKRQSHTLPLSPFKASEQPSEQPSSGKTSVFGEFTRRIGRFRKILVKYAQFIGPGFLIAVAYIDPGNYATDVNGT
jgi:metal iron transporter